ncbi:type II CRISPR RNA-guided endonuclease Cas9 [Gaoshiqia sp. Z1-71]|uniref:type II CRISPR RNA-guided endonuclease Cas9 n=1 Tax=Gaoshiqia hydrogeniformans TaxID=3290090 RepID=UPI003BF7FF83
MKKILGLDLGTNSIGWALVSTDENGKPTKIEGLGSRIIPMDAATLSDFEKGNSKSQTAERTRLRGARRLRERYLLRRERLHRILKILNFLPEHYSQNIDFEKNYGKFLTDAESKLAWKSNGTGKSEFLFPKSFDKMVIDFAVHQPQLLDGGKKIPYDWTIYYLRKKALISKIEKEELAWVLLNFNQKRGYYQLRGEEEEENPTKLVEFHALKVVAVEETEEKKGKESWYNVHLENGWIYRRTSNVPLDWIGKIKEFVVTTDINEDGTPKLDKEGREKRSFRAPKEDDWTLIKKKTEADIAQSKKTVGRYIYDTLLEKPNQKIRGKLVRTIERKFYKEELKAILEKQKEYHPVLKDRRLYAQCIEELYQNNEAHRNSISSRDFTYLFLEDIIFYQRPLKSKKSLISNCPYEERSFLDKKSGAIKTIPVKCIAKSHPLFQEFRLWQFIANLKIYQKERIEAGRLQTDIDVTDEFLKNEDDYVALVEWLNDRKDVDQKAFLKYPGFDMRKNTVNYRWNYVEDKPYPCNETRALILARLKKYDEIPSDFLSKDNEKALWHILYSVEDKYEIVKALQSFAIKHQLDKTFVDAFSKFPTFKKDYGSYSAKAIKRLLPLMRRGKYWNEQDISDDIKDRILSIKERLKAINFMAEKIDEVTDDDIPKQVLKSFLKCSEPLKGLNTYQACYAVYGRHSEAKEISKWNNPDDIDVYLKSFKQHSLRNPIVEQVITETLRVVRDIWKKYGNFAEIHVELGREMKNPADKRKRMTEQISENENANLRIKSLLMEFLNPEYEVENVRPYSPGQQEILRIYEDGVLNSGIIIPEYVEDTLKKFKETDIKKQPSKSEILRYKLWLEQKYRSPYTNEVIPLGKLFTTAYQIEHIIPQSRYFDDSFNNKIICEAEVNQLKDNELGYEFIKNHHGEKVELNFGKTVEILSVDAYEKFVKESYSKNRGKMKKLLMEDIPDGFIERQLNDTRYISKVVKGLLSNIVREDGEEEATSKNLISCTGGITDTLKKDWGLNDVWNNMIYPRFDRLNQLTNSNQFGRWENKNGKRVFQIQMPFELQKGFSKKRIDHRHHAMDALVIACATRSHVNYLNNEAAKANAKETRYDLRRKLRRIETVRREKIIEGEKVTQNIEVAREFYKPWDTFTQDAQKALENVVVSFKQNLRVINKTTNYYESFKDENGNLRLDNNGKTQKGRSKQVSGDSWAIRKPLHKATVMGIVNLRFKKKVSLSIAIDNWEMLVNKNLKTKIKQLMNDGFDKKKIQKFFASSENKWEGVDISNPELYYFSDGKEALVASRTDLNEDFNTKAIESITDTGIQKILVNHLRKYDEEMNGKIIEHPELAFSPEGIEAMNENIKELNGGSPHKPILKIRTFTPKGNKFNVGLTGNKKEKFVVAEAGTNLYFAVYNDETNRRSFETVQLNVVIDRLKVNECPVLEEKIDDNGKVLKLLFYLNPNDLVYVPTPEQVENNIKLGIEDINSSRIYRFVDSSDTTANFVPASSSSTIFNFNKKEQEKRRLYFSIQNEYGVGSPQSKNQKAITGEMIKECCIKLQVDRIGVIKR